MHGGRRVCPGVEVLLLVLELLLPHSTSTSSGRKTGELPDEVILLPFVIIILALSQLPRPVSSNVEPVVGNVDAWPTSTPPASGVVIRPRSEEMPERVEIERPDLLFVCVLNFVDWGRRVEVPVQKGAIEATTDEMIVMDRMP